MLVLLQGLIPKKPEEEEGKQKEDDIEDIDTNSSEEGDDNLDSNYLTPDNLL